MVLKTSATRGVGWSLERLCWHGSCQLVITVTGTRTGSWTGWREFEAEQREHQQPAEVFGDDGYVWSWAEATFENWQSEFLQLFTMVALTSFLVFKGSPESRDGDDEMKATLERIERRLDNLISSEGTVPREDHAAARRE